ncbi:DNA repair protein [Duganella sp. Leaf126]|uniref:non-homologous end joining protein Ku n=1 Tax=Duganella sp. Leaf126 TaxID=1736266 RepID=UPI0006FD4270|nr:Ku protein [Duganella sp. Leaf126]KQQ36187.1 DNA repair protein [Duganella sp. Leaf126]
MAARALWKGAISFGLVHIPVDLYTAVQEHGLDLSMLDRRDFSPVGYKRYNKKTGKDVEWDDIVKGYEYEDGEYVVLTDEDLKRANVEATQTIDIQAFVDAADVPLTYYEHPYYLAPSKGGAKVYALLRETLRKAGKIGIATVVIRTRQHLCALVCMDDKIVLNTLRFDTEIRDSEDLKLPPATLKGAGISDKELTMALSLVEGMSEEWKPSQYHDTYQEDVMALVKKKIKAGQTKTLTAPEPERKAPRSSNVVDLVALLQDSLGKRPAKGAAKDKAADEAPAPRKRASPAKAAGKSTADKSTAGKSGKTATAKAARTAGAGKAGAKHGATRKAA